jgi:hypothetical protein
MVFAKEVQGNVAVGTDLAKQILGVDTEVGLRMKSGAVVYHKTKPHEDRMLHRPTYENNLSVLVDAPGNLQIFQFEPNLVTQPRSIDLDIAHSLLDGIARDAKKEAHFEKEKAPIDEIAWIIKQQERDTALKRLREKETLMLEEGFSPEEIASLTSETRERILRKYEVKSRVARMLDEQGIRDEDEFGEFSDVGSVGASATVGVNSVVDGPRTVPPLSVPGMDTYLGAGAGMRDAAGRVAPSAAPSQGFVASRLPVTTGSMAPGLDLSGQRSGMSNLYRDVLRGSSGYTVAPPGEARSMVSIPDYGSIASTPRTTASEGRERLREMYEERAYVAGLDPLQRGMRTGMIWGDFASVRGLPEPHAGRVAGIVEAVQSARAARRTMRVSL